MKPKADFNCRTCEAVIEYLPIDSKCCPVCGKKRGFFRIYNNVNIGTGMVKQTDMLIGEEYERVSTIKQGAAEHVQVVQEAKDRVMEKGTSEMREAISQAESGSKKWSGRSTGIPSAKIVGAIDADMRQISRERLYPSLTMFSPKPRYT